MIFMISGATRFKSAFQSKNPFFTTLFSILGSIGLVWVLGFSTPAFGFIETQTAYTAGDLFHAAIKEGEIEDVKKLLAGGFNPSQAFEDGITPLHLTIVHNQEEIAKLLLQNGASVKAKDATTQATPLHFAALYGRANLATLLLQNGADVNDIMKFNITPLLVAAQFSQPQLIELLLQHKANINHCDQEGFTALHFTATNNDEASTLLLIKNGANVNAKDKREATPLKIAQERRAEGMVRLLKENGAKEEEKKAE